MASETYRSYRDEELENGRKGVDQKALERVFASLIETKTEAEAFLRDPSKYLRDKGIYIVQWQHDAMKRIDIHFFTDLTGQTKREMEHGASQICAAGTFVKWKYEKSLAFESK